MRPIGTSACPRRPRTALVSTGWTSSATAPAATRYGTIIVNVPGGVTSSSTAPTAAPTAATGSPRAKCGPAPVISCREVSAAPGQHAAPATRFVTFAGSAGIPAASSAGYDTSDVIPPAEPTTPATTPASSRKSIASDCPSLDLCGSAGIGPSPVHYRSLAFLAMPHSGPFVWHELRVPDLDEAARFYGAVFGWTFVDNPMGKSITHRGVVIGGAAR